MATANLSYHMKVHPAANKAIFLGVSDSSSSIRLLGSTVPTSVEPAKPGGGGLSQIVLYPEQGKNGIVAISLRLSVSRGKCIDLEYVSAFLVVTWKEKDGVKYPFIALDDPWISAERIGQPTPSSIEVMIKGKRFSSYFTTEKDSPAYVPNGNLLCGYLWGTTDAAEVFHSAVQQKVAPFTEKRLTELRSEVCAVIHARDRNLEEILRLRKCLAEQIRINDECFVSAEAAYVTIARLKEVIKPLCKLFERLPVWVRPKPVDELIGAFKLGNRSA